MVELAAHISTLVGAFYVLLCFLYASMSTLAGQGRQSVIAAVMLVGSWGIATPLCHALTFGPLAHIGIMGIWWGFVGGYFTIAVLLVILTAASDWPALASEARVRSEVESIRATTASPLPSFLSREYQPLSRAEMPAIYLSTVT